MKLLVLPRRAGKTTALMEWLIAAPPAEVLARLANEEPPP